ncbi:DUF934 domain-containing protein [Abyssibacter sp.]|uniref:DUF934 domain-containing protein n=1 Tax=Abyssibacter sp. TaxID=2320200 RepID=UPI0035155D1E
MILLRTDGSRESINLRVLDADEAPTGAAWEAVGLDHPALAEAESPTGLTLANDVNVETLDCDPQRFAFILLDFPAFTDGRAYSQARVLSEQLGYQGTLVAGGELLQDQAHYLKRCGFNAFALADAEAADRLAQGFNDFTAAYQATSRHELPVYRRRRA